MSQTTTQLRLAPLHIYSNWKIETPGFENIQVRQLADRLEDVLAAVAQRIRDDVSGDSRIRVTLGRVRGATEGPNQARSLRVMSELRPGHRFAYDFYFFRSTGNLLGIRTEGTACTSMSTLRVAMLLGAFGLGLTAMLYAYWSMTGARFGLAMDYARKYAQAPLTPELYYQLEIQGQMSGHRWTITDFMRQDPKLFMERIVGPPVVLAGVLGFVLHRLPRDWVKYPCRILGWPTPDAFRSHIAAFSARMADITGEVLAQEFGRYEHDMIRTRKDG